MNGATIDADTGADAVLDELVYRTKQAANVAYKWTARGESSLRMLNAINAGNAGMWVGDTVDRSTVFAAVDLLDNVRHATRIARQYMTRTATLYAKVSRTFYYHGDTRCPARQAAYGDATQAWFTSVDRFNVDCIESAAERAADAVTTRAYRR